PAAGDAAPAPGRGAQARAARGRGAPPGAAGERSARLPAPAAAEGRWLQSHRGLAVTRTTRLGVLVALIALPALAQAAGPEALSLKAGAPAELLGKTLAIARGLFALSLVLGLLVEAFGGDPSKPKSYGGVAWRALVVVALLAGYPRLFG